MNTFWKPRRELTDEEVFGAKELSDADVFGPQVGGTPLRADIPKSEQPGIGIRSGLSIKMTPEGQLGFLENYYGKGNVRLVPGEESWYNLPGRVLGGVLSAWTIGRYTGYQSAYDAGARPSDRWQVKEPGRDWTDVDPSEWSFAETGREFGDYAGDAIVVGPAFAAAATPGAQAAALGAGSLARQGVSALLPGDDNMTIGDRAFDVGLNAAIGGATQGLFNLASRYGTPAGVIAGRMNTRSLADGTARGVQLEAMTGIPMTAAQQSGSKSLYMLESGLRQHIGSADIWAAQDKAAIRQAFLYFDNLANKIGAPEGQITVGNRMRDAFEAAVKRAFEARSKSGRAAFGAYAEAAKGTGRIPASNTISAMNDLIREFGVPEAGPMASKLSSDLSSLKQTIGGGIPAERLPMILSRYSEIARGNGLLFEGMERGQSRMIAARVLSALDSDMAAAVASGKGPAIQLLRAAREQWRLQTEAINGLQESALGRLLGGKYDRAPETIIAKLRTMNPSEVARVREIIESADPITWQSVKAQIIDDWIRSKRARTSTAQVPPPETTPSVIAGAQAPRADFSPAKFLSSAPEDAWIKSVFKAGEVEEIAIGMEAIHRIAYSPFAVRSQTTPLAAVFQVIRSALNPASWTATAGEIAASRHLSRLMTDSAKRQALIQIGKDPWWRYQGAAGATPPRRIMRLLTMLYPVGQADVARTTVALNTPKRANEQVGPEAR